MACGKIDLRSKDNGSKLPKLEVTFAISGVADDSDTSVGTTLSNPVEPSIFIDAATDEADLTANVQLTDAESGALQCEIQGATFASQIRLAGCTLKEGKAYKAVVAVTKAGHAPAYASNTGLSVSVTNEKPSIDFFVMARTPQSHVGVLKWRMSDNATASANLEYKIYQKNSAIAEKPTTSDTLIASGRGNTSLSSLTGPINATTTVNYLLVIKDEAGNEASAWFASTFENSVTISFANRNTGPLAGGTKILIGGNGFFKTNISGYPTQSTVKIGGNACTSVSVLSPFHIICVTPPGTAGAKTIEVLNPDGSSGTLVGGFTYEAVSTNICDLAPNPSPPDNFFHGGSGTSLAPYLVCTFAQLNKIRNDTGENGATTDYQSGGKYYLLMDNIDLNGTGFTPLSGVGTGTFTGSFNGGAHFLENWTFTTALDNVGLFGEVSGSLVDVDNLGLLNINITGANNVGGAIGYLHGLNAASNYNFTSNFVTGSINATASGAGGFIGQVDFIGGYLSMGYANSYTDVTVSSGTQKAAGFGGRIYSAVAPAQTLTNIFTYGTVTTPGAYGSGVIGHSGNVIMTNVASHMTVNCAGTCGGLMGSVGNTSSLDKIVNSQFSGTINSSTGANVGGLVGYTSSPLTIQMGLFDGTMNVGGTSIGGILGKTASPGGTATIEDSYSLGDIIGTSATQYLAGMIGEVQGSASLSRTLVGGSLTGNTFLGGIIGRLRPQVASSAITINESVVWANLTLLSSTGFTGGFVGRAIFNAASDVTLTIQDSEFTGNLATTSSASKSMCVGSLVYDQATDDIVIRRFLAAGKITSSSSSSDSAIYGGPGDPNNVLIDSTFFNKSLFKGVGEASGASTGSSVGKKRTELTDQTSNIFSAAGWDFTAGTGKWEWAHGNGYPIPLWYPF